MCEDEETRGGDEGTRGGDEGTRGGDEETRGGDEETRGGDGTAEVARFGIGGKGRGGLYQWFRWGDSG